MDKSIKYSVRKLWLNLILAVGVINFILGTTGIILRGIEFNFIITIVIGVVSLYLFHSFSHFGYVAINKEKLTINNGLNKTKIQLSDINRIIKKQNSYRLFINNRKTNSIGLSFIEPEMRNEFIEKLLDIENKYVT